MNTVRINGQDYTSSLSDTEIAFIGNLSLPTTAQTLSGAIAEHENDISELNSKLTIKSDTKTLTTNGNGIIGISSEFNLDMSKTVLVGIFLEGTYKYENYYTRNSTTGAINYNIAVLSATASTYTRVTNTSMTVHIMYLEFNQQ